MPVTAKLSSKYQITIPRDVREALDLGKGERVVFEWDRTGRVVLRKQRRTDSAGCGSHFLKPGQTPVSVEEMQRAIDEHFSKP